MTINSLWNRPLLTTYYLFGFINNVNYQIQLILIIVQNPFGLSGCGLSSFILIIVQNPFGSSGCGLSSFTAFCSFIIRSKPIWLEWLWVKFISLGTLLNIVWVYTWQIRVVEPFYYSVPLGTLVVQTILSFMYFIFSISFSMGTLFNIVYTWQIRISGSLLSFMYFAYHINKNTKI